MTMATKLRSNVTRCTRASGCECKVIDTTMHASITIHQSITISTRRRVIPRRLTPSRRDRS